MRIRNIIISALVLGGLILTGCQPENSAGQTEKVVKPLPTEAKVLILIYHQIRPITSADSKNAQTFIVPPEIFEQQLQELKARNYQTISFKNLADYFAGNYILPALPVIISFDDGTPSQYTDAFPLLVEYGLTATFFIFTNAALNENPHYLSWAQLKEMAAAGMEIGSHTRYHQYLTKQDAEELPKEIVGSKETLEKNIGVTVTALAYPFGDKNDEIIQMVKAAGYTAGRDIVNGTEQTDLFKLKAYFVTNDEARFDWILTQ